MSAMRDDELAFSSMGRDAMWMKIAIFALGSGIAGFAGGLYAHYFRYITPEQFEILQSSAILTMVVVGGMRTTWGPVIGALLLQALPQAISFLGSAAEHSWAYPRASVYGPCAGVHVLPATGPGSGERHLARAICQASGAALMAGVLEIKNMSKSFDGIVVADGVDLYPPGRPHCRTDRPERRRQDVPVQSGLRRREAGWRDGVAERRQARWAEVPSARP